MLLVVALFLLPVAPSQVLAQPKAKPAQVLKVKIEELKSQQQEASDERNYTQPSLPNVLTTDTGHNRANQSCRRPRIDQFNFLLGFREYSQFGFLAELSLLLIFRLARLCTQQAISCCEAFKTSKLSAGHIFMCPVGWRA
ncbi:hypothetical protein A8B75_19270 [Sphingomonadales bacterium EhC05]|nr:hypothetical protein A8B75_19270 [Sphingomonadales bacterium EhC05]